MIGSLRCNKVKLWGEISRKAPDTGSKICAFIREHSRRLCEIEEQVCTLLIIYLLLHNPAKQDDIYLDYWDLISVEAYLVI